MDLSLMNLRAVVAICFLGLWSCSSGTGTREDENRITGLYALASVDGMSIPAPIAPQQGCNRVVRGGLLSISARGADVQAMYDWTFVIDAACEPVPPGVFRGATDVGTWSFHPTTPAFSSLKGLGDYDVILEEPVSAPPALTVPHLGNSYKFVRVMRFDDPQGVVYVKFVDQVGQPVAGVILTFTFANGIKGGGTTPETGEFGTRGVVGECSVSFVPPEGYHVPVTQSNPFSVSVVEDGVVRIEVALTRR